MFDRSEFKRRYLLRLLGSPLIVGPAVLGMSVLTVAWAFSMRMSLAAFAALACFLGSAGAFLTRILLGSPKVSRAVIEDMQKEAARAREKRLDDLDRRLLEDGDPRNETLLRDLRALAKSFGETSGPAGAGSGVFRSTLEIAAGVEELFNQSVMSLERTLDLWRAARAMATEEARKPLLEQRERILREVGESVAQLGRILAGIQGLRAGEPGVSELARLRKDLDRRLSVARKVEERMRNLENQIEPSVPEPGRTEATSERG